MNISESAIQAPEHSPPHFQPHCVDRLRAFCESQSTRTFNARGIALKRCSQCLLGLSTCICHYRKPGQSGIEFILLMHRDEVYKPTNTGRLIADLYPQQTHAFAWDRTRPPDELLELIADPRRHCQLVFPPREGDDRIVESQPGFNMSEGSIATVILLDGTWKQARKMYSQSQWLKQLPLLNLESAIQTLAGELGHYKLRQACESGRLATAEAGALCLSAADDSANARKLLDYFTVFNEHYVAARMNRKPQLLTAHTALSSSQPQS
ncbi:tRNA-uridine aminocarboxypropyltransferase [Pseudomaricurvus sp.]|uniref:tRNA-uridine aminocarboxypropyltransferase n=1 Tax=Pseudomaricurvus sp. TaxID=2004510 RepID=UPI003F6D3EFB